VADPDDRCRPLAVGLDLTELDSSLVDQVLVDLLAVLAGPRLPLGHRPFIHAKGRYDGLEGAAMTDTESVKVRSCIIDSMRLYKPILGSERDLLCQDSV